MSDQNSVGEGYREARHDGIDCLNPRIQLQNKTTGEWVDRLINKTAMFYGIRYRVPLEPMETAVIDAGQDPIEYGEGWRKAHADGIDCLNPKLQVQCPNGVWSSRHSNAELDRHLAYRVPAEPMTTAAIDAGEGWREARHDGLDYLDSQCQHLNDDGEWVPRHPKTLGQPFVVGERYRVPAKTLTVEPAAPDDCVGECFDCGGPISREKGCPPCDLPPLVEPEWYYLVKGDIMSTNDEYRKVEDWLPTSPDAVCLGRPFDPDRYWPRRRRITKPESVEPVTETTPVQNALATLSEAMFKDSDFAWTWHCNVAMVAWDAGAPICEANERAADFIKNTFGVDVRATDEWRDMPPHAVDTVPPDESNAVTHDPVHIPAHYTQGPIECVDWVRLGLTAEEYRGWLKGNAMAYLFREKLKGSDEDLDKASRFLTFHNRPKVTITIPSEPNEQDEEPDRSPAS